MIVNLTEEGGSNDARLAHVVICGPIGYFRISIDAVGHLSPAWVMWAATYTAVISLYRDSLYENLHAMTIHKI